MLGLWLGLLQIQTRRSKNQADRTFSSKRLSLSATMTTEENSPEVDDISTSLYSKTPTSDESNTDEEIALRRVLGLPGAASIVVGGIIGSGIFVSARWVVVYSGSVGLALCIWVLCGFVAFVGGLCWVELALTFPKCGGSYILIKETLGPVIAFSCVWVRFIVVYPAATTIIILTLASYLIEPFFPGCTDREDLQPLIKLTGACSVCIFCLLNCLSATWAARVQVIFTIGKIIALVTLIITGIVWIAKGKTSHFSDTFKDSTSEIGTIALAFQSGLWAYEGWDVLPDITEEVKRPVRNMPWAIIGGVCLVTCSYVLVNVAYVSVLSPEVLKSSPATAVAFGYHAYGPAVARIIPVIVALSLFGSVNCLLFTYGGVMFSAAREGHMPGFMATIHKTKRTPIFAMCFRTILGCLLLIPDKSTIKTLISLHSSGEWITYLLVTIGLLWTRYRKPDLKRPFKMPIVIPVIFLFISLYMIIVPFLKAPFESSISVALILTGLPVYYFCIYLKVTPKFILRFLDWISFKSQQVFNVRYPTTITTE